MNNFFLHRFWAWKPNFFIIKKTVFFFKKYFKLTKPTKPTTKNRIAIGQKTDLRQCASVSIMKKPISIGSVINLEKNRPYRTTHTPTTRQPSTRCLRAMIPPTRFKTIGRGWLLVSKTVQSHSSSWVQIGP